jgi:hypothetical protein
MPRHGREGIEIGQIHLRHCSTIRTTRIIIA